MRLMAPPGVGVVAARVQSPRPKGGHYRDDVVRAWVDSPDLQRAGQVLGTMPLDHIGIAYASGCLIAGMNWDETVTARVSELAGGIPCVGSATAMLAACRALGMRQPLMVVPAWFSDALVEAAVSFGAEVGIHADAVLRADMGPAWKGLDPHEVYDRDGGWLQDPRDLQRSIRSAVGDDADGVVVLGSGLRAAELVATLEDQLLVPVVTPQQALLWHWLRSTGIEEGSEGYGRLFACPLPLDKSQEEDMDKVPAVGDTAPAFELRDGDGPVGLEDFRGRKVVLFFYPQAFTGGCTEEACSLRDEFPTISEANAAVIGISVDDIDVQERFREEYGLPFPVLSDPGGEVCKAYGVFGIKRADGSVLPQSRRATFIIDENGTVAAVFDPVSPQGHGAEVQAALKDLAAA
jgi:peroxiredoxin/maleate cis-trans isomerase